MAVTIVEHDGGRMIDFGDRARVERRFRPEQEAVIDPKTGTPVIDPVTKQPMTKDVLGPDGNPVFVWVAYEKVEAKPNDDGKLIHPVHGDATTHEYVWVIRGQGTEAEARAIAEKIAA